jgi:hypothetical protein
VGLLEYSSTKKIIPEGMTCNVEKDAPDLDKAEEEIAKAKKRLEDKKREDIRLKEG